MMSLIKQLAAEFIQPTLKSSGFRKKAFLWNRKREGFVDVISLQEASYSTDDEGVFTVNVGICVPEFNDLIWPNEHKEWFNEAECAVRLRLGDLIQNKPHGNSLDQWWTLSDEGALLAVGEEIHRAIETKALPFLKAISTFSAIDQHLQNIEGWQSKDALMTVYSALAKWKSGDHLEAEKILAGVQDGAWNKKAKMISKIIALS